MRLYEIGSKGLWLDEAFSIWMARQPVPQILSWLVRIDQHPPLYYLLLHQWLRFGEGEAAVRALSALLSTLTIPVFYLTELMGIAMDLPERDPWWDKHIVNVRPLLKSRNLL